MFYQVKPNFHYNGIEDAPDVEGASHLFWLRTLASDLEVLKAEMKSCGS